MHRIGFTVFGHLGCVHSADFSINGSRVITNSGDGTAKIWDSRTRECKNTLSGHGFGCVYVASFSTDGFRVVIFGHLGCVHSADFSINGSRVITNSGDGTAKIWDSRTGECKNTLSFHK